jgi:hypothetical protein
MAERLQRRVLDGGEIQLRHFLPEERHGQLMDPADEMPRNRRLDDEELTQAVCRAIAQTFDEDAIVLATQQRQLEKHGGAVPRVAMKVDDAPLRTRRLLDALMSKEAENSGFVYRPALMIEDVTPKLAMV